MVDSLSLTQAQARRFILSHQGLCPPRSWSGKAGILEFFLRVGCIQFDPLNIVGQNPELVLQSRIQDYRPQLLNELLYTDRKLLDGWDKMMAIYPVEDYPSFHRQREADRAAMQRSEDGLQSVLPLVRNEIEQRGPLSSLDLDFDHRVDWPWGPTRASRAALESLYFAGELVVHHKANNRKYYDLASRHLPPAILQASDPNPVEIDYQDWYVLRRLASVGLLWGRASTVWLAMRGVDTPHRVKTIKRLLSDGRLQEARIEGISEPVYLRGQDMPLLERTLDSETIPPQASFIAPLDNLMWDRRLVELLFGFEYRWEVYTPPEKRKYGYYVLPVLYGDRLIARLEPILDKRTRLLTLKGWWWEPDIIREDGLIAALVACFDQFLAYLNAASLQYAGATFNPGDMGRLVQMLS